MTTTYTLGATSDEQTRLAAQRELYGDTLDLVFDANETVAELGCGPFVNHWIAAQLKSGRYIGVDIQKAQLDAAQRLAERLGLTNVTFREADASQVLGTGLACGSVDHVFARCLLVHLSDPAQAVREMHRVAKVGGCATIIEPDDMTVFATGMHHLMKCWRAKTAYTAESRGTKPEVSRSLYTLLRRAGFSCVEIAPHVVRFGGDPRVATLVQNWLSMIERVASEIQTAGLVSAADLDCARDEVSAIKPDSDDSFATLTMWRAFAKK